MKDGCVESCLPIKEFAPTDEREARLYLSYIKVHDAAVSCHDLEMAAEYRRLIENTRSDICLNCKVQNAPLAQIATESDPDFGSGRLLESSHESSSQDTTDPLLALPPPAPEQLPTRDVPPPDAASVKSEEPPNVSVTGSAVGPEDGTVPEDVH